MKNAEYQLEPFSQEEILKELEEEHTKYQKIDGALRVAAIMAEIKKDYE